MTIKYIITRQGLKTPRSKKLSRIDIASFSTLQEAINTCKNSGFSYAGTSYFGGFLEYQKDGCTWKIEGEAVFPDGKTLLVSYKTNDIEL